MAKLTIERCPETGICSILKADGAKVDLMPDEVMQIRVAAGDVSKLKEVVAGCDPTFADGLDAAEVAQIVKTLAK